jgi:hypothetical protein
MDDPTPGRGHHQPRLRATQSVSRADSANSPLPRPIRSPKSVPDRVFPSRRVRMPRHISHLTVICVIVCNGFRQRQ